MGFEALLGNQRLKENLTAGLRRGRTSHFYLISGPAGSGKRTLAQLLSAALICRDPAAPCFQCAACRKVMGAAHPDVITVTDPEHKNVAVKIVREIRDDMFIRPNEAEKKIYIFPQELGIEGQNALLKILEEPPSYGVYILLTDNPEKLLPTVRSRCVELRLQGLERSLLVQELRRRCPEADPQTLEAAADRSGGYLGQALALIESGQNLEEQAGEFARAYGEKDSVGLLKVLSPMEKWDRERLLETLNQWLAVLQQALVCRSGVNVASHTAQLISRQRSSAEILQAVRQLQKVIEYAQGNVSPAAICGFLTWSLR